MKRLASLVLASLLVLPSMLKADEFEISVNGTPVNVTDYKLYSDSFPAGHAGPGEVRCTRINFDVRCDWKVDVQPTTSGVQFAVQFVMPFAFTSSNYAYEIGNCNSPGGTRGAAIFGSQVSVEGNNTTLVMKAVPNDNAMRAYACSASYKSTY